jgi:hypothetical protein
MGDIARIERTKLTMTMRHVLRNCSIVALVVLMASTAAWAQATAELNGRVTDESGAVLPGVTVTVMQTATGLERTTVTDGTGTYLFTNLPPGPYRLEVTLQGFRSYVQTGLVLTVGATPTVNAVLGLGSLEETVTVEAAAPLVDVRSAGISSVVENEEILELPLEGRQVTDLLVLAGAAVQTATATSRSAPGGVRISVGGGFETGVAYMLDGATHNNTQENINYALPFPDALQEFRVATSGLTAQNGVKSGASVSAVTKSGTNRFSGNAFEFMRHHDLNGTDPFAALGPDGKPLDDGLKRNQFGGTLGGPIVQDKMFFFGGYQGTATRTTPVANIARVPTAQMLAGDLTSFASAQCQGGRDRTLRAPYVNNMLDPSLVSQVAKNISARLPDPGGDPCGEITYGIPNDSDEHQMLGRVDFQLNANQSVFGRYFVQKFLKDPGYAGGDDNILKSSSQGSDATLHAVNVGTTSIFGASTVNAVRFALNKSEVDNYQNQFFCPTDVGVMNYHCYAPGFMVLNVTGGFNLYPGNQTEAHFFNDSYQVADDLTLVRGNHQFGFGANVRYWAGDYTSSSRTNGAWRITGSGTGLGLADLIAGRITTVEQGNLNRVIVNNTYIGAYVQDSWRASDRVTFNAGMRWEPFFGQNLENDAISNFSRANFDNGVVSTRFPLAPPGLLWPGDAGFPSRQTGMHIQWWNLSPRAGVAWDVHGDGRLAVRSSYAMAYDFMAGEFHNINSGAPPFGNRSTQTNPSGGIADPYSDAPGGNPHPLVSGGVDTPFVFAGGYGSMDPNINSPRIQNWNVTVEQQLGTNWGVAASYIGSYSDRIWGQVAQNPGVFLTPEETRALGIGSSSTNANLQQRRVLTLANPEFGQYYGGVDINSDAGYQKYRGLKLSVQRRAATGVSLSGNYTLGRCYGLPSISRFNQTSAGYKDPTNPDADAGYCIQDRRHLATLTVGYLTPEVDSAALRAVVSNWRLSGILSARTGNRLNIIDTGDRARTGIRDQRPDKVSDDFYGEKTLDNYFNPDAFSAQVLGTNGNLIQNAAVGPNFWNINLAVSKLVNVATTQQLELRFEVFNLLDHFNWGNPNSTFSSGTFGRITSMAGEPRVLQLGVKYGF